MRGINDLLLDGDDFLRKEKDKELREEKRTIKKLAEDAAIGLYENNKKVFISKLESYILESLRQHKNFISEKQLIEIIMSLDECVGTSSYDDYLREVAIDINIEFYLETIINKILEESKQAGYYIITKKSNSNLIFFKRKYSKQEHNFYYKYRHYIIWNKYKYLFLKYLHIIF